MAVEALSLVVKVWGIIDPYVAVEQAFNFC